MIIHDAIHAYLQIDDKTYINLISTILIYQQYQTVYKVEVRLN